jgi:hypothetical protein
VDAIELPLAVIASLPDGRRRVRIEVVSSTSTSAQLHRVLRGQYRQLEIIDAAGNYWSSVAGRRGGISWRSYLPGGPVGVLVGVLAIVLDLLFLTVLVRVHFVFDKSPERLSLSQVKTRICDALATAPELYTHAPAKELIGRVRRAKSVAALIKSIGRD